ncbi:MAG: alpha/beta hydrolase [Caldilinea sp.]|nr:alpha/beta hydrolase [Caldilinea sp.]
MGDCSGQALLTVDDYRRLPVVSASRRFFYGAHPSQFGDLFLPETQGPHPVAVLVHGGCWQAEYGLAALGQLAQAIAVHNVAVWNIEYRRLGDGGGWPHTFLDVGAALDFLRTLAEPFSLDLHHVVTAGHSAGGHLALWLAARARLSPHSLLAAPDPLRVDAVVSIAGIPDLIAAARRRVCDDAISALMQGAPEAAADRYHDASPAALTPLGVPHLHVHGRQDTIAPVDLVEAYVEAAILAGDHASTLLLEKAGHFEPVDARTGAGQRVIESVVKLLRA